MFLLASWTCGRRSGSFQLASLGPHRAVCLESNPSLRDGSLSRHTQSSSLRTGSFDYTDISTLQAERQFSFAPTYENELGLPVARLLPACRHPGVGNSATVSRPTNLSVKHV